MERFLTRSRANFYAFRTGNGFGRERPKTTQTEQFNSGNDDDRGKIKEPTNFGNEQTEELRIVIIGKTGTGKSATGNSILGIKEFESAVSGASVTDKCKLGINKRFGRKIVLVDTPGLFDTGMTNEQVIKEIVKCIGMTAPGPHAILLTVTIGRFTKEEQDTVKHFVDYFGVAMYNYLTVVFTRADDLQNETIDSFVRKGPQQLKSFLHDCNNRCIAINNKLSGSGQERQVQELISIIDDAVRTNGGCCYTNEMYEEAEKTLRRRELEIKRKLEEEEKRKIEDIRCQIQADFDKKFDEAKREQDQLKRDIRKYENERDRGKTRAKQMWNEILDLKDQLHSCQLVVENKKMELKQMITDMPETILKQQQGTNDREIDDKIKQLKDQMDENKRKLTDEIANLKEEHKRKENEIRKEFEHKQNSSVIRDNDRRGCEKETSVLSQVWGGLKRFGSWVINKLF